MFHGCTILRSHENNPSPHEAVGEGRRAGGEGKGDDDRDVRRESWGGHKGRAHEHLPARRIPEVREAGVPEISMLGYPSGAIPSSQTFVGGALRLHHVDRVHEFHTLPETIRSRISGRCSLPFDSFDAKVGLRSNSLNKAPHDLGIPSGQRPSQRSYWLHIIQTLLGFDHTVINPRTSTVI